MRFLAVTPSMKYFGLTIATVLHSNNFSEVEMKITRLKRGYRINMSDTEFELYLRFIDSGKADLAVDPNLDDPIERYYDRINGTEKISAWVVVAEDRRG